MQSLCYTHAGFSATPLLRHQELARARSKARVRRDKLIGRVDVSESASLSSGIAARYATAVFELAKESKTIDKIEADITALGDALTSSDDLKAMIASPVYTRADQAQAIGAVASKMGLTETFASTLGLMASKRRLFALPHLLSELKRRIADDKGEVTAEVTAAKALTEAQEVSLAKTLKEQVGQDVQISLSVDESLIGGLIVKVGSKMIDTSVRSKLVALQNTMKEVG